VRSHEQSEAARIRASLTHPVIDSDGHIVESQPAAMTYLAEIAGKGAVDRYHAWQGRLAPTPEQRLDERLMRLPFWNFPSKNTLDRATVTLPALLNERMAEFGFDFTVLYPTMGMIANTVDDDELRPAACRAFNTYNSEILAEFADRMTPAAVIPMHTPSEAIAELDYSVHQLGAKVVMLATYVHRPIPAAERLSPEAVRFGQWFDTYGLDSAHDYDAVWRKCLELGVNPTFHTGTMGTGSRRSPSSYVHNHIGHFAAAAEGTCRALFLGGVTRRFPELKFAFMEGGVAWGCSLYADIIGHWEKRNRKALANYDPKLLDHELFEELYAEYGSEVLRKRLHAPIHGEAPILAAREDPASLDEWAACEIESAQDIRELFTNSFYFGCEADDPLSVWAYRSDMNPLGARMHTLFGSDIGHWDVPDMRRVLPEAHELLEHGHISDADFRDFVFANPARFWTATNPDFFKGSAVESEVSALLEA
jgi:predicted TIM-barrel fold metal-dependent hydrolase